MNRVELDVEMNTPGTWTIRGEVKMNYLEIIELRSIGKDISILEKNLTLFLKEIKNTYKSYRVYLYHHALIETDWSFHIHFQSDIPVNSPSSLGIRIAGVLRDFGLVNHSLWSNKHENMLGMVL